MATVTIDNTPPKITEISLSNSNFTNQNIYINIKCSDSESGICKYKIKRENGGEQNVTLDEPLQKYEGSSPKPITRNGTYHITVWDNVGNETTQDIIISNIDKTKPVIASVNLSNITSNSLGLNIKGKDEESGISKIRVYINDKLENEFTYSSNYNEIKNETFTKSELLANTKYTYYIEVIDQVGNVSVTEKAEVITSELPELDVKFTETPSEWTNSDVKLKVDLLSSLPSNTAKLQYRIETLDGKVKLDYKEYTKEITLDSNCIVKVRYIEDNNTSNEKVFEVKNIDKDLPIIESLSEVEVTGNSFKINVKFKDELSGFSKIKVYVDDKLISEYAEVTEGVSFNEITEEVTGLESGKKYKYYIEVEDKAGNILSTKDDNREITTLTTNQDNNAVNTSDKIIYYVIIVVGLVILVNVVIILIVKSKIKK